MWHNTLAHSIKYKVNTNTNKQTNTGKQTQNKQKGKAQLQVTEVVEDMMAQRHQAPKKRKHNPLQTQRQRFRSKHKFIKSESMRQIKTCICPAGSLDLSIMRMRLTYNGII